MSGQVRKPKGFSYKTWAFRSRVVLHKTLSNNPCRNWLSSEAGGEAMMNSSQVGRGGVLACFGVRRARMGALVLASVVAHTQTKWHVGRPWSHDCGSAEDRGRAHINRHRSLCNWAFDGGLCVCGWHKLFDNLTVSVCRMRHKCGEFGTLL